MARAIFCVSLLPGMTPSFPDRLIERLRSARRVAVLTGAGISAESGIPTFRDAQAGLWANYDPQQLASPEGFARNPQLVWSWYAERRARVREAMPNAGHRALAELARRYAAFTLVTQNVDGLHQRAGSQDVIELHGNLTRVKCAVEGIVVEDFADVANDALPPRCACGAWLRPDVVWFGESLPPGALEQALAAAQASEVFFSIGTSAVVFPAADLPWQAAAAGALLVEINPQATALTPHADVFLAGAAGTILPALVERLRATSSSTDS